MTLTLNGAWTLYYVANKRFVTEKKDISTIAAVQATGWDNVPARVPGNMEIDLARAGVIDDVFYGTNCIDYRFLEYLHLIYVRTVTLDRLPDENTLLHFEGIDTVAEIFVNGQRVGTPENMLIGHDFPATALRLGENEIIVHITPAAIAAQKYDVPYESAELGGRQYVMLRKAPHMIGWDILPRCVSGGIWKHCEINYRSADRINDIFAHAKDIDPATNSATLVFDYNISVSEDDLFDYAIRITGKCGTSTFQTTASRLYRNFGAMYVDLRKNAKLWWPHNYGEPNVYDCKAELLYKGEVKDEYTFTAGIRSVRLERTSTTDENGNGEFCFYINNKKIFWMGSNWVPADALHSRDRERLPEILPMLSDLGCNCIRCWGGNVYEDDYLYDYCDRHGIMVWQDFSMACAYNPQDEAFQAKLAEEVRAVVRRLRSHVSITLWAGDNEVDSCYYRVHDPNKNVLTRKVIPEQLHVMDETRPYLPSSPYIDETAYTTKKTPSEQHLWGPRDYFKSDFYAKSQCHFASETGYHGCPSPASLKKFIHPEQLWSWRSAPDSDLPKPDWCVHSSAVTTDGKDYCVWRIRMMSNQVKVLFDSVPEDLDHFARASQISQAEAKKYFIERFRVTKWRRTGIIWWNLIDGWPEISDAVVDYYYCKKLAYKYIKRSQQTLCLICDEPAEGRLPLHVVSDLQEDVTVHYQWRDLTTGETVSEGTVPAVANTSAEIAVKDIPADEQHFYLMTWYYAKDGKNIEGKNHYMTGLKNVNLEAYFGYMRQAGFADEFEGF